jgi:alkylation response protein AidB-like acyl-CoA dehydrogenase
MDFAESSEHELLRDTAHRIAIAYGHSYYSERARRNERADELWSKVAREGLLGVNVPEEYGGSGLGIAELAILSEEFAAVGCPLLMLVVTPAICASIIARHGTDAQKRAWLPPIARDGMKMAFALTEPNAGSNSHRLETTAVKSGDDYVIRGAKTFISGIDESQSVLVAARTSTDERGRAGLSLFIVDTNSQGLSTSLIPVEIVAPEKQFAVFFDEVRVPAERRLGAEGEGLRALFSGLNPERITAAATSNGIARYALDKASTYANERKVWDVPIGAHQGLAHPLARAKIDLELARLMTQKAAWLFDRGLDAGEAANMAKFAAAECSLAALDQAIQTHGGNGLTSEYGLADLWGLARLLRTAPVSREMILNFVAQHSLGLPRSY